MNVSVGAHWDEFVAKLVKGGRYGSASEVIRHGLRLLEGEEDKLKSLRENVQAALDEDVWFSWGEVEEHVRDALAADQKAAE